MPSTLKYSITYPAGNVAPNVPLAMQTQAESVEAAITTAVSKIRHAEYTTGAVTTVAGVTRNAGALTVDATKSFNTSFGAPDVAGKYKVTEAGVYAFDFTVLPGSPPGTINLEIVGTSVVRIAQGLGGNYGAYEVTASTSGVYLPANEVITFSMVCNNAVSVAGRVRVTKLQGV